MWSGACIASSLYRSFSVFIRTKFAFFVGDFFVLVSSLHSPLILLQSSRRLHFSSRETPKKRGRNEIICGAFLNYFFLFFFRSISLSFSSLTRGVYQTHNLKFRAFCRLWLAGRAEDRSHRTRK